MCLCLYGVPATAKADVITEWIEALKALSAEPGAAGGRVRTALDAQVALAMFEAVNAIQPRYQSYLAFPPASVPASPEAAASAAAHSLLKKAFPARAAALDAALAFNLHQVDDAGSRAAGVEIGLKAADAVLARKVTEEGKTAPAYRPPAKAGVYIHTEMPIIPLDVYLARPWILATLQEVRLPDPPALTSERYARDVEEVRRLGVRMSSERTAEQTAMAAFWAGNRVALAVRMLTAQPGRSLVSNARFHALLELAADDANKVGGIAKYDFAVWRPITAIRNGDIDDNPVTIRDPAWMPLLPTPAHAEYPCGHCLFAATFATLFEAEFGPECQMVFIDPQMPGAMRAITPAQYVREVSMSRIYAGVHYRFSNEAAEAMGQRIASLALERIMRPLKPNGGAVPR